jgi:hypothetical protein
VYYQVKAKQSVVQLFTNVAEPVRNSNSINKKRSYRATVFVEMHCFERNFHRSSIRTIPQPHSPMHDISYTWTVNSFTRALSLALVESGVNQLKSSVFPGDRAGPILFYATLSSKKAFEPNKHHHPTHMMTTGLCYALLCKPKAADGGSIQIEVSIADGNDK